MAWTNENDANTLKELFTSGKVDRIEWEYSAGGDSLNDSETIYFLNDVEVRGDFYDPTDYILDNVDIAEASDGHYLGEAGTVTIKLEDDELTLYKDYQSEWSESYTEEICLEINKEQFELLNKIDSFDYDGYDEEYTELKFKYDYYISREDAQMLEDLAEEIRDKANDFLSGVENREEVFTITFDKKGLSEDEMLFNLDYRQTVYVDES